MRKTHLKIIKISKTKVHGCHMALMQQKINCIHKRGIWEIKGVDAFAWEV